ncbi:WD repeat-containing protein mio [Microtus ochrogaster]|uniref:WD repeat-containing protein mio n=1 Tax=Microtus ochrogaster TaxID=79684 RepID=A0A8J6GPC0_MICOH|nr:WD repeat-containing protein mio [Microtus ochrogaster]
MSGTKPDILWAPHQVDRFVVCDSELSLYHVESAVNSELKAGSLRLSEDSAATLLSINSDTPYMKCVAWYLNYDPECLLAVGQANGRVVLTSLGQDHNSKFKDLIGKEFVPKHARQCNTLAWNPLDSNWLAAGLDKHRADFSVLIWDICSKYTPDIVPMEKVRLSAGEAETTLLVTKPLYELGQNDACLSLCWLPRDQKLLLAGMHRNLAIFDLRNTSQKMFVNTKAVQGVTVDPYFHDRVASFYEGMVESTRHNWSGLDKQTDIQNLNEERILALQLCGWVKKGTDVDVGPFLNSLVQEGEWERAAAVALFNLDIRRAIQILNEGASSEKGDLNLNVVAMALSGYTDEKNSLWREMCSTLRLQLNNPYLCVMFAFLTSEAGAYDGVLLNKYIEKLTNEMKEAGNLEGILLTGLTKDGVDLMESYVDRTGDVQTASYCMLQGSPLDVLKDERVQYWIENYRNLLDAWRFWHKRAEFDIHRSKLDPSSKPLAQVFVSCNFCGKSISYSCSSVPHQGRGFSQYGVSGSPTKSKVTSCPGCRKPLPRCALCLINMGTPVSSCPGGSKSDEKVDLSKDKKLAQFNNWFTWCHNCRHGGHAGHMLSWFRDHAECPVSACTCKCMQLDTTGNLVPAETVQP